MRTIRCDHSVIDREDLRDGFDEKNAVRRERDRDRGNCWLPRTPKRFDIDATEARNCR